MKYHQANNYKKRSKQQNKSKLVKKASCITSITYIQDIIGRARKKQNIIIRINQIEINTQERIWVNQDPPSKRMRQEDPRNGGFDPFKYEQSDKGKI